jgi:glucokinase
MSFAIGIDIGVTNAKAVGVTPAGQVLFRESFETHAESPDWPAGVKVHLNELENAHGRAGHVGVAAPGVAKSDGSCIRWMRGRLAEVQDLNWGEFLGRRVPVLNDAQAALLGEVWQGAARGASNAILFTLGTGVGGAAIVDGRLLRGHLGRAGHLGHVCLDMGGERDIVGTPGSLEMMIGNYTIGQRSGGTFKTTHELVDACRRNDPAARQIWERSIEALACAIVSMVNVLDPEVVIVGGGVAVAGDVLFGRLVARACDMEWSLEGEHVRIVPASLGEYAGAIGAAWNAIECSGFRVQGSGVVE